MTLNHKPEETPVAIIGAGLTGLCLAHRLIAKGIAPLLADKGRYPGGRMAARAVGQAGLVNTGPRFFMTQASVDEPDLLPRWLERHARLIAMTDVNTIPADLAGYFPGFELYEPGGSIRELSLALAQGLEIQQQTKLVAIEQQSAGWKLRLEATGSGEIFERFARTAVLTMPAPQIAEVLTVSGLTRLLPADLTTNIAYERSLVGLFEVEMAGKVAMQERLIANPDNDIRRIIIKAHKHDSMTVYIESTSAFAENQQATAPDQVLSLFQAKIRQHVPGIEVKNGQFHRWNFARIRPDCRAFTGPVVASEQPHLIFAGEGFGVTENVPAGL
ncbi:MAG: NAD(P)-binding protein, partial [bacterium]